MRLNVLARKVHYWAGVGIALPLVTVITTGVLLQVKKQWGWVQPPERRGSVTAPAVGLDSMLASMRAVPALGVTGWDVVQRLDIRVGRGVAKATLASGVEVQIDIGTGAILQSAYRRSDTIEALHDGSYFLGDLTKLGLFLPSGVFLLGMVVTGLWLFWLPFSVRRRRRRADDAAAR